MSEENKKWYQDPDGLTKIIALVLLLLLLLCLHLFAGDFIHKACRLAVGVRLRDRDEEVAPAHRHGRRVRVEHRRRDRREERAHKNAENADNDEQLDECKAFI